MVKSQGLRKKTRAILKKHPRERGMSPLGMLLHEYKSGEKVVITINPSVHKGMPHTRYQGKVGIIIEGRGRAYVVKIDEGGKTRNIIARPEHIMPHVE